MAFFDFDRKIQTLLIAGALASLAGCGGTTSFDGSTDAPDEADDPAWEGVDPPPDAFDTLDTGVDTLDAWEDTGHIDPPVDALDPDMHGVCPDPATWAVLVSDHAVAWPVGTFRIALNILPEFVDDGTFGVTALKKSVTDIRAISPGEYEIDYQWSGPLEHSWWDWDRLDVTWNVVCVDAYGTHERSLAIQQILCVTDGSMWVGWGSTGEECMVVDCVPDTMEAPSQPTGQPMPRGVLKTDVVATRAPDGTVRLRVVARGAAAKGATHEWKASGGEIHPDGDTAAWHPPITPGIHAVQVVSRSGDAMSVEVYKLTVQG